MRQELDIIEYEGIKRAILFSIPDIPTKKAILDFHGNGEMGNVGASDTEEQVRSLAAWKLTNTGFGHLIKNGLELDYLIISPMSWSNNWDMGFAKYCYDYAKKKYNFEYCFGHGISMGGLIDDYASTYPSDLIAVFSNAPVRFRRDVSKRKHIPSWEICGTNDKATGMQGVQNAKHLIEAGGTAFYTLFEGMGHWQSFWNSVINGTIKAKQITHSDLPDHRKEYKPSNCPVTDWFDTLISNEEEKPLPISEPEPIPDEPSNPTEPMQIEPIQVIGSHPNPEIMFEKSSLKEKPEGYYQIPWNNPKWWAIAEFSEIINIKSINYFDSNGKNDFKISFSEDGKTFSNPLTADLGKWEVWRSLNFDTRARYIKVEGDNPILPVRIMIMTGDKVEQPKLYNLTISDATETEKNKIIELVGDKVKVI